MCAQSCLSWYCFTYLHRRRSFVKTQVKLVQNGSSEIPCVAKLFVIDDASVPGRKLSGWHSFADRCLQVQDTPRLLIYRLVIFAATYRFVFYSSTGGYGRSGSTKGNSRGHRGECLRHLSRGHVHVLEGENKGCVFRRRAKASRRKSIRAGAPVEPRRDATRWLNPWVYVHSDNRAPCRRGIRLRAFFVSYQRQRRPSPGYRVLDISDPIPDARSGLSAAMPRASTSDAAARVNSTM